ncbi:hypothetical protein BSL78_02727 [Apostichopus japonicus]|uniref:C2H2-type domain-containing protein n=1 Tax=Stichopus japonicus TaxID=307972 RepID=A0A2G8LJC6_STIJA|nr:hypothetical protein BSL78_02727 [Apostichopus japonicus]
MAATEEGLDDTFSADSIIARALMNDTPSSALEEPDPHCMLSPSMVVPQAVWMIDDSPSQVKNHAPQGTQRANPPPTSEHLNLVSQAVWMVDDNPSQVKNPVPQGTDGANPPSASEVSYADDPSQCNDDSGVLDSLSNLAHSNSNLFILNIPNTNLAGGSSNQNGAAGLNGIQSSSLMPVLLVGGGNMPKGGAETTLPSFLRFKDFAQANLIYTTQENIAKTYNTPAQPKQADKIIKCEECGRSFKSSGHYRYHIETHKGNRVLKCPINGCNRRFAWPGHLKYHVRTHSNDRPYPCKVKACSKTFYTVQSLDVHMRSHNGVKPFECPEEGCGKSFTTSGNLTNHIRTHTGEKPYLCTYADCNLSFAENSSLKKHRLTHTGEKPYECEICGKLFSQCSSRNAHRKRHKLQLLCSIVDDGDPANQNSLKESGVLDLTLNSADNSLASSSDANTLSVQDAIKDQENSRLTLNQSVLEGLGHDRSVEDKSNLEDSGSSSSSVLVLSQQHTTLTMATNPPLHHNPANPGDSLLCNAFLQSELEHSSSVEVVTDDMTVNQSLDMADSLWHTQD